MTHEMDLVKKEMKNKSVSELGDILARQEKLVANKKLLSKLPDKGKKVELKYSVIRALIEEKSKTNHAEEGLVKAFSRLGLPDTDAMEWKNKNIAADSHMIKDNSDDATLRVLAEKDFPSRPDFAQLEADYLQQKIACLDNYQSDKRFAPFCSTEHNFNKTECKTKTSPLQPPRYGTSQRKQPPPVTATP